MRHLFKNRFSLFVFLACFSSCLLANTLPAVTTPNIAFHPTPPEIQAKGYVLMDAKSGSVIAAKNAQDRLEPASLTKIMTMYVASNAITTGQVHLDDTVTISQKAWRMSGSKMFLKIGDRVKVEDLLKGIIVASGNDACVALAEAVAGSEESFVSVMNQTAKQLGMNDTHFMDTTGLPDPNHYSTPHDMAILARALIRDFPQFYAWYSEKWLVYNQIRQPNRNRLLWRENKFDGIKTGHTDSAGYCLVGSGEENGMRLISVVMGEANDQLRTDDSQRLLNFGFRFYQSIPIFKANQVVTRERVWMGDEKEVNLGLNQDLYITVSKIRNTNFSVDFEFAHALKAHIQKGDSLGTLQVKAGNETLASVPLVALQGDAVGGFFSRMTDSMALWSKNIFGSTKNG